jgi:methionyl aminopeptidase
MSIRTQAELEKLRAIGRIVRLTLDRCTASVRPGITTRELDEIGSRVLAEHGAESAPPKVYGFPGALCISVNDEAIHGIPGDRALQTGDLVKLDLVAEEGRLLRGRCGNVGVGGGPAAALVSAPSAFHLAAKVARAGNRVYDISAR